MCGTYVFLFLIVRPVDTGTWAGQKKKGKGACAQLLGCHHHEVTRQEALIGGGWQPIADARHSHCGQAQTRSVSSTVSECKRQHFLLFLFKLSGPQSHKHKKEIGTYMWASSIKKKCKRKCKRRPASTLIFCGWSGPTFCCHLVVRVA